MICKSCGKEIKDGSKFCTGCGAVTIDEDKTEILTPYGESSSAPVINPATDNRNTKKDSKNNKEKKTNNKALKVILTILIVLLVILAAGFFVIIKYSDEISYIIYGEDSDQELFGGDFFDSDDEDDDIDDESDEEDEKEDESDVDSEDLNEDDEDAKVSDEPDLSKESPVFQQFYISSEAVEDYSKALDYTKYKRYDSGIDDFLFSYPANLFHSVVFEEDKSQERYGLSLQEIHFSGSNGTELFYCLYQRTDSNTVIEETRDVHEFELSFITDPTELAYKVDNGYGLVILTGYLNDSRTHIIYNVNKIDGDYVKQMRIYYPADVEDSGYVVETLYRMCGFGESSVGPRDYDSWKAEN